MIGMLVFFLLIGLCIGGIIFGPALIRRGLEREARQKLADADAHLSLPVGVSKGGCGHGELVEVDEHLTGEIIAYICGLCGDQLSMNNAAATRFRRDKKLLAEWEEIKDQIDSVDEAGNQTVGQAERFALRSQAMQRLNVPTQMLWDRLPGWTDEDTSFAQEVLRPQVQAVIADMERRIEKEVE